MGKSPFVHAGIRDHRAQPNGTLLEGKEAVNVWASGLTERW
jgi:hypothetical protein